MLPWLLSTFRRPCFYSLQLGYKKTKWQIVSRLSVVYVFLTFSTNILGEIFCRADHSEDLPIKTSLIDRYDVSRHSFVPPKKAEILRRYGPPIATGIPTKKTSNIPERLRYCINNSPDREVLVYKETDRNGRTFYEYLPIERSTQILRSPISISDRDIPETVQSFRLPCTDVYRQVRMERCCARINKGFA